MRPIVIMLTALALSACQTTPASSALQSEEMRQARGFAQAACGGCHGVERYGLSANPEAPEWPTIVNRPGLTEATLRDYLLNAHNYPEQMDFYLDADEVDRLVAYMLTLQQEHYRLPPS